MYRINQILQNKMYNRYLLRILGHEEKRSLCNHDLSHFLDVARIAYIMTLESGLDIAKEHIYAAALLHDIGRFSQYETGEPHEQASAHLCIEILSPCGFDDNEIFEIKEAILNHRNNHIRNNNDFKGILFRADKASRPCHHCHAESECNWDINKKNMTVNY